MTDDPLTHGPTTDGPPPPPAHQGSARTLEVRRDDLSETRVAEGPPPTPAPGEAVLAVDGFALTANNLTYAHLGDQLGYWRFFPTGDGWGRIPAWGHAVVSHSTVPALAVGTRVYGLLPMSTHLVVRPDRLSDRGFVDRTPARRDLPKAYNAYRIVPPQVQADDRDRRALLEPVFLLSYLADDWLAHRVEARGANVVVTSGSSRAALGLAFLLRERGAAVVALTSPGNVEHLRGLGVYGAVVAYDAVHDLEPAPTVVADIAGDDGVVAAVRATLGAQVELVVRMGWTHGVSGDPDPSAGTGDDLRLFVPDLMVERARAWGPGELARRVDRALVGFSEWASGWMRITRARGPAAAIAAYERVRTGSADPTEGNVLSLRDG